MMLTFVNVIWGARCGKTARRVLLGETRTRGHAHSVRRRRESACDRKAPHRLKSSRLVSTNLLDLWFELERVVKSRLRGEAYLVRYIDDFVLCFQDREDALRVQDALRKRLGKFGLTLEAKKTKLVESSNLVALRRSTRASAAVNARRRSIFWGLFCTALTTGKATFGLDFAQKSHGCDAHY
jgi:hypothetical protein